MRVHVSAIALVSSLLCACTQPPAPIVDRGRTEFTRERSYAALPNARAANSQQDRSQRWQPVNLAPPEPATTQSSAGVQTVAVNDLAPPSPTPEPPPASNSVTSSGSINKQIARGPAEVAPNAPFHTARNSDLDHARPVQSGLKSTTTTEEKLAPRLTKEVVLKEDEPFQWPVKGKVISRFGPKGSGIINEGVNIAAAKGQPVKAAAAGKIAYAGNGIKGYGNMVLIKHAGGRTTAYAHLSKMNVKKGDSVKQGALIGAVGDSGNVKAPQLHFAIREGTKALNPEMVISSSLARAE